jgi:hypothetical protein
MPDYHTPPAYMNNYQRDIVKTAISGFKTTTWKGKGDRNMCTDQLVAGTYIESMRKGYTLPTFEHLVRGLQCLPAGLDARGLTQCLSWYLGIRDTFTPRLELNVLHAQSLIRALREPLKPFGPQKLDRNALEEWRNKGTFETVRIGDKDREGNTVKTTIEQQRRAQLHLNLDEDKVSMNLTLPIRHILTFPFLALHGVVGEALKLGIGKVEMRQVTRKEEASKRTLQTKRVARAVGKDGVEADDEDNMELDGARMQGVLEEPKTPYRIPKRPRLIDIDLLPAPEQPSLSLGSRSHAGTRWLAPTPPRSQVPSSPQNTSSTNRSWIAPIPSSVYMPQQQTHADVYGRREYHARQPAQGHGATYQHERPREGFGSETQYSIRYGNDAYGNGYWRQ